MTIEQKINGIIGKPFSKDFHCYNLVEFLSPSAPKIIGVHQGLTKTNKEFKDMMEPLDVVEVSDFINGDIIFLGSNNIYYHAGVYYDDGMVHTTEDLGTIYQTMSMIKILYSNIKGFRS